MKNTLMMGTMFVAGMAVVSSSFAFRGNEEVTAAIDSNDYTAFVANAPEKLLEKVTSEADFVAFVAEKTEKKAAHEAKKVELEAAVASNDFVSFQAIKQAAKAERAASRPDDAPERPELSDEQVAEREVKAQEKFEELVTYYNENGELPERGMKKGMKGKHGGDCEGKGKKGDGEGRGGKRGERVQNGE